MLRLQSELGDLVGRPGNLLEAKHRKHKGREMRRAEYVIIAVCGSASKSA